MRSEQFVEEVMRRAGFQQPSMASLAIDATLEVLGQRLRAAQVRELQEQLPPGVGEGLLRGPHGMCFDREELYRRVSRGEGVRMGFAVEHAQVVCQVLAEALAEVPRVRLQQQLPEDIAELISPREPVPPLARRERLTTPTISKSTLATGRPGSRNSLSDAGRPKDRTGWDPEGEG